jgi:hypothetical protein
MLEPMVEMLAMPLPGSRPTAPVPARAPRDAAERTTLLERLDTSESWPDAAASLLARLGFRLIGRHGADRDTWHLLVALREPPSLEHFDPELVSYYAPAAAGAELVSFDRREAGEPGSRIERRALWGHVHVVDRVPVENRFLTFGGDLRIAALDPGLTVVDLSSPAPIVRWGGHSQGTDELAEAIGAFFGRLVVPIDFVPGAARRIDALPAGVLYRAFLADGLRRAAAARQHGADRGGLDGWLAAAWSRARTDEAACDAGQRLLRELDLG